ncbi:MAG: hypothetical protein PVJ39_07375 [Gammaproteobacteria bacterium]|jgi:hypothetical protein
MKATKTTISFYLLSGITIVCPAIYFGSQTDSFRFMSMAGLTMFSLCWIVFTFILTHRDLRGTSDRSELDPVPENINFNHFYGIIESSIKEDLNIIRAEIRQVESLIADAVSTLGKSFSEMNTNVQDQYLLIKQLTDAAPRGYQPRVISQIDNKTEQIKINTADAIRSLQFEDITVQVAENSIQYLDNIEKYLDKCKLQLNDLYSFKSQNTQAKDAFQAFAASLQQIRQQHRLPERKAARQQDLSEGGVELF